MQKQHIVHLTTVHNRADTRILFREVASVAQSDDFAVTLIVADGNGSSVQDIGDGTVNVHDVGALPGGRLGRPIFSTIRAVKAVLKIRPAITHFHDPELVVTGIILRFLGYKVIYDVHEDVPRAVLDKYWLPRVLRRPLAWSAAAMEWIGGKLFAGIVSATPKIAKRFPPHKTVVVHNFPILSELSVPNPTPYRERENSFVYVGAISELRGAHEMVQAVSRLPKNSEAKLDLAGPMRPESLEEDLRAHAGFSRVRYHGWASREQLANLFGKVKAGLVILHPTPAYVDAYPVKMFEYMAAELPVISSDFPLWREIVEGANCGLLVDPMDLDAIVDAMQWIIDHPEEARDMGQRGRKAVEETYSWDPEEKKLLSLYQSLLNR